MSHSELASKLADKFEAGGKLELPDKETVQPPLNMPPDVNVWTAENGTKWFRPSERKGQPRTHLAISEVYDGERGRALVLAWVNGGHWKLCDVIWMGDTNLDAIKKLLENKPENL